MWTDKALKSINNFETGANKNVLLLHWQVFTILMSWMFKEYCSVRKISNVCFCNLTSCHSSILGKPLQGLGKASRAPRKGLTSVPVRPHECLGKSQRKTLKLLCSLPTRCHSFSPDQCLGINSVLNLEIHVRKQIKWCERHLWVTLRADAKKWYKLSNTEASSVSAILVILEY